MPKKWKIENDKFIVYYEDMGANYVANHDLGFQGKNAGIERIEKLKKLGLYEKIKAYQKAEKSMNDAWIMAFGPDWAKDLVEDRSKELDLPWSDKSAILSSIKSNEVHNEHPRQDSRGSQELPYSGNGSDYPG